MSDEISNMLDAAFKGDAEKTVSLFNDLMADRVATAVDNKRVEIASTMFNQTEETVVESHDIATSIGYYLDPHIEAHKGKGGFPGALLKAQSNILPKIQAQHNISRQAARKHISNYLDSMLHPQTPSRPKQRDPNAWASDDPRVRKEDEELKKRDGVA